MSNEKQELVLKEICSRLLYDLHVRIYNHWTDSFEDEILTINNIGEILQHFPIEDIKPYLRPMSSMTNEEKKEHDFYCGYKPYDENIGESYLTEYDMPDYIDFLYEHRLDFRGLISMDLAIEEQKDMYKF